MKIHQTKTGFSLVETLVASALVSVLSVVAITFLLAMMQARSELLVESDLAWNAERLLNIITTDIREADAITAPVAGASGAELVLEMPLAATDPTVFSVIDNVLFREQDNNGDIALHSDDFNVAQFFVESLATGSSRSVAVTLQLTASSSADKFHTQTYHAIITKN